jgi:hypothetical protein
MTYTMSNDTLTPLHVLYVPTVCFRVGVGQDVFVTEL